MSLPSEFLDLASRLDFPRDTPAAMACARDSLEVMLRASGLEPERLGFLARVGRAQAAGLLWLVAAYGFGIAAWRRLAGFAVGAVVVACAGLLALGGGFDSLLPVRGLDNLEVVIEPQGPLAAELVLAAHYDSKTEVFDHPTRGGLGLVTGTAVLAALAVWWWRRRAARVIAAVGGCGFVLLGIGLAAPLGATRAGHGIADNAAAALLLVEQARITHAAPLTSTRVRFLWFAAEEWGAQGSAAWGHSNTSSPSAAKPWSAAPDTARGGRRDAAPDRTPANVVLLNLECLGAGPELGVMMREWSGRHAYTPDPILVATLTDAVLVATLADAVPATLHRFAFPGVTDAGSVLRHGVRAATLIGLEAGGAPPRHLHHRDDTLAHLDPQGLEAARRTLRRFVLLWDERARTAGSP